MRWKRLSPGEGALEAAERKAVLLLDLDPDLWDLPGRLLAPSHLQQKPPQLLEERRGPHAHPRCHHPEEGDLLPLPPGGLPPRLSPRDSEEVRAAREGQVKVAPPITEAEGAEGGLQGGER